MIKTGPFCAIDFIGTLEKIARATKEHDDGRGIPVDEFFHEFEKKHGLTRDGAQERKPF